VQQCAAMCSMCLEAFKLSLDVVRMFATAFVKESEKNVLNPNINMAHK
jgi:hypothetical protein